LGNWTLNDLSIEISFNNEIYVGGKYIPVLPVSTIADCMDEMLIEGLFGDVKEDDVEESIYLVL
jgi:hypothetical protein